MHGIFGDVSYGGCPACEQNLRDMWCAYTCSPDQHKFVTPLGIENITNPTSGILTTVLHTDVKMASKYACAVFGSCSATQKVKTYAPINSCEGFLSYQAGTGAMPQGAYLTFTFSGDAGGKGADPEAMFLDYYNCCSYPANFSDPSAGNTSCPCATCGGCCAGGSCYDGVSPAAGSSSGVVLNITGVLGDPGLTAFTGFNGVLVGGIYGALLFLSLVVLGLRSERVVKALPAPLARFLGQDGGDESLDERFGDDETGR